MGEFQVMKDQLEKIDLGYKIGDVLFLVLTELIEEIGGLCHL